MFLKCTGIEVRKIYYEKKIISGRVVEVLKTYTKIDAKNTDRGPKEKATEEEMKKNNEREAIKKLTRIMNCNFVDGDLHIVLTYKKDKRPTPEKAKKEFRNFINRVKRRYKKNKCKWVMVTEYKNTAIHHHLVINNIKDIDVVKTVMEQWKMNGIVHVTPLYSRGNYKDLAEYFVKETKKTYKEHDGGHMQRWTCSRNLSKPKVVVHKKKAKSWSPQPKARKGYTIDNNSIVNGTNAFSGRQYQYYIMVKDGDKDG